MKKIGLAFLMLSCFGIVGCTQTNQQGYVDPKVDMSVREISVAGDIYSTLEQVRSAVVGISVDLSDGYAVGSGVAITNGGYILTNFHVIEGGKEITLYFADKTMGTASVLWADPGLDMAVLKSSREIPYLSTDDLGNISIGQDVYSIGTPLTLQFKHTVTKGIVSALDRTLETESTYGSSFLQSLVQHDASINPGNSGGPLVNSKGQVIGINTLKAVEGEGIGFAIPIALGKLVIDKIIDNNSYQTPYLGIFAFDSALAEVYGQKVSGKGVYVVSTTSVAKEAGLVKGDFIIGIDGNKINNMLDFRISIFEKNIGDTISITYIRGTETKNVNVTLTKRA